MMGTLKGTFFPQQILNKNRLCLAHCALNRSFTVNVIFFNILPNWDVGLKLICIILDSLH